MVYTSIYVYVLSFIPDIASGEFEDMEARWVRQIGVVGGWAVFREASVLPHHAAGEGTDIPIPPCSGRQERGSVAVSVPVLGSVCCTGLLNLFKVCSQVLVT